jgi:glycine cleavage system H protein
VNKITALPADCFFHGEHMWVRPEHDAGVLGITYYAQERLGDVTLVVVPAPGTRITRGEPFGTVESAKAASDLIAPVDGEIVAVNEKLADEPWLVNDEPYGRGWILRIRLADPAVVSGLLTAEEYAKRTA